MSDLSKIVYLSAAQYETLKTNGTITVDGTTINYSNDDLYLTPDITIPTGGTTGQTLTKASATDYDTVWAGPFVPSSTSAKQIYGTDENGAQTTYLVSQSANASSIPQRFSGGRMDCGTPTSSNNCTNKDYVDTYSAKVDASNLSSANVTSWNTKLKTLELVGFYPLSVNQSIDLDNYDYVVYLFARGGANDADLGLFSGTTFTSYTADGGGGTRTYAYCGWGKAGSISAYIHNDGTTTFVICSNDLSNESSSKPTAITMSYSGKTNGNIAIFRVHK